MITTKPRLNLKSWRPPERRRVTLIEAWRTKNGIVLHADSQETVGDYRVQVDKVEPIHAGDWEIIVAGAGSPGTLIDSFPIRLRRSLSQFNSGSISDLADYIENELGQFYVSDVALCPSTDRDMQFLVAAASRKSREYECWISNNITLRPISENKPELIGWAEALYAGVARRFFYQNMHMSQAVLAGLYLLTIADGTCNYVKEPFVVCSVSGTGIWREDKDYVASMTSRLRAYESDMNQLFLACANTEISPKKLDTAFDMLKEHVRQIHKEQIDSEVARMQHPNGGLLPMNSPFSRVPPGTLIEIGSDGKISNTQYDIDPFQKLKEALEQGNTISTERPREWNDE